MAKIQNEFFIGKEYLNIEGRDIKHLGLIKEFGNININKIKESPIKLNGLDLETNPDTAELKLLGFYNGKEYNEYRNDFFNVLCMWIKYLSKENTHIAYWNKLDPNVLYKQFLKQVSREEAYKSMEKFGKISGKWDKKNKEWEIDPVIEIKIGNHYFGIENAIRSSIKFYFRREGSKYLNYVWAYDIAQLYEYNLEREALGEKDEKTNTYPNARLKYYSKLGEEFHKINWNKFEIDEEYRKNVLYSNELDARAVYDLGNIIQEEFFRAFKWYPNTLVSSGSLARASIVAIIKNMYEDKYNDLQEAKKYIIEDINSIALNNFKEKIIAEYGEDLYKDLFCLACESYSGGYIEAINYGMAKKAYYADIASAYPSVIRQLYDLRNCKITEGKGLPPHIEKSYCFIRGEIFLPLEINYQPITIKHLINKSTNIRAVGEYKASYTIEERDFLLTLGAKFSNEYWINIKTEGKLSPLALVENHLLELRNYFKENNDSAQYIAKKTGNSLYGILFEAIMTYMRTIITKKDKIKLDNYYKNILKNYTHKINLNPIKKELKFIYNNDYNKIYSLWHNSNGLFIDEIIEKIKEEGLNIKAINPIDQLIEINNLYREKFDYTEEYNIDKVIKAGYRGGEFFNPIYASIITSRIRILISKACNDIEKQGGNPILIMTDSIFWEGKKEMLSKKYYKENKTIGYFEKPKEIKNLVCLGSGRYSFEDKEKGYITTKKRGLNVTQIADKNKEGEIISYFNWLDVLKEAKKLKKIEGIKVNVRALITVGVVLNNSNYDIKDLGLVKDDIREIDLLVGRSKRFYPDDIENPDKLLQGMIKTRSINLSYGMLGDNQIIDQTLPILREETKKKKAISKKIRDKKNRSKASNKYNKSHRKSINIDYNHKYKQIREYGYTSYEARKMAKMSMENLINKFKEDNKI